MSASDFSEDLAVRFLFTADVLTTRPTTWFVSLHTADPTEVTGLFEVTNPGIDTNYARVSATFVVTVTPGQVKNSVTVTFPAAAAVAPSYTVTHFGIFSALTGGNFLGRAQLDVAKVVVDGTQLSFAINDLTIEVT